MNRSAACLLAAVLAGCTVGPDYKRPDAPVAAQYKEAAGWKPAAPQAAASDQPWWSVYDDPVLSRLEQQVAISNQTIKQDEATYRNAVAIVAEARSSLFPTFSVDASATRSGGGSGSGTNYSGTSGTSGRTGNSFSLSGALSWDLDLWGEIRRTVESDVANAEVSAADLAGAKLSEQATLATDYFDLRSQDELIRLYNDTIAAYQRSLDITQNQYKVGVAAKADVLTAQTQLQGAQAAAINLGVARAQYEHAIAVLVGETPDKLSLDSGPLAGKVPVAPTGVPATLLERRPDVAASERQMASANALIGVADAAYYPDVTLSASEGQQSGTVGKLLHASSNVWSVGPSAALTLLDFGARDAAVEAARATYDAQVAGYRQTVLTAFQQVEDELAALRILEKETDLQEATVQSANEAVRLTLNEYKAGTVAYTTVVTAQATALADAQTLVTIRQNRLTASVALIQALGGGWDQSRLPTTDQIERPPIASLP